MGASRLACLVIVSGAVTLSAQRVRPVDRPGESMNTIAEQYVKLVLAVGRHDADYVDAFLRRRPSGRPTRSGRSRPLPQIDAEAERLIGRHARPHDAEQRDPLVGAAARVPAAAAGVASRARADAPGREADIRRGVAGALRRRGPRAPRFVFPGDDRRTGAPAARRRSARRALRRVPAAIRRSRPTGWRASSIARSPSAARARCRTCSLPDTESFTVEYVTNKPWSGYNWYQGNYRSLIQVNTDLPIYIDRAIDLACHEGYPGHHVYNALLEKHLVRDRGWVEFSVYALFSPQSLIAEGTANYGIEVAFPGEERTAFERDVLFPLAGLDASQAATYAPGSGARRRARLRRQRGGAKVPERRDRSRRRPWTGCRATR